VTIFSKSEVLTRSFVISVRSSFVVTSLKLNLISSRSFSKLISPDRSWLVLESLETSEWVLFCSRLFVTSVFLFGC
jgi:hypothetical protein